MRGTDFRAPKTGLTLIVARPFETLRDAQQGLGRVGRFGEKCYRIKVTDVALVDERADELVWARMFSYTSKLKPRTYLTAQRRYLKSLLQLKTR